MADQATVDRPEIKTESPVFTKGDNLEAWASALKNPLDDAALLEAAAIAYAAENGKTWDEHIAERRAELTDTIENGWFFQTGRAQRELDAMNPQAQLAAWAAKNYVPKNEAFLAAAENAYNSIHGEGAWGTKVGAERTELEDRLSNSHNGFSRLEATIRLNEFNPDQQLAEWGQAHLAHQENALDWSNAAAFGLDGDVFKKLDSQNPVADETMANRDTEFGKAWLNGAEILYNANNGENAWAERVADKGWNADEAAQELADYGESQVLWFENNLVSAGRGILGLSDEGQVSMAYLMTLNGYTESTWGDLGGAVWRSAADPTFVAATAVGAATLGTGAVAGHGARIAAQQGVMYGIRQILVSQTVGTVAKAGIGLAVEGAATEYALGGAEQKLGVNHGMREGYDQGALAERAVVGAAASVVLGGTISVAARPVADAASSMVKSIRHSTPEIIPTSPPALDTTPSAPVVDVTPSVSEAAPKVDDVVTGDNGAIAWSMAAGRADNASRADLQAEQLRAQRERQAALNAGKTDEPQIEQPVQQQQANAGGTDSDLLREIKDKISKNMDWQSSWTNKYHKDTKVALLNQADSDTVNTILGSLDKAEARELFAALNSAQKQTDFLSQQFQSGNFNKDDVSSFTEAIVGNDRQKDQVQRSFDKWYNNQGYDKAAEEAARKAAEDDAFRRASRGGAVVDDILEKNDFTKWDSIVDDIKVSVINNITDDSDRFAMLEALRTRPGHREDFKEVFHKFYEKSPDDSFTYLSGLNKGISDSVIRNLRFNPDPTANKQFQNTLIDEVDAKRNGFDNSQKKGDPSADPTAKTDASDAANAKTEAPSKPPKETRDIPYVTDTLSYIIGGPMKFARDRFFNTAYNVSDLKPDGTWPAGKADVYARNMDVATNTADDYLKQGSHNFQRFGFTFLKAGDTNFFRIENNLRILEFGIGSVEDRANKVTELLERGYVDAAIEGLRNAQMRDNLGEDLIKELTSRWSAAQQVITDEQWAFIKPIFREGAPAKGKKIAIEDGAEWAPFGLGLDRSIALRYPRTTLWNIGSWLMGGKMPDNVGGSVESRWIPRLKGDPANGTTGINNGDFGNIGRIIGRVGGIATGITPTIAVVKLASSIPLVKPIMLASTVAWAGTNGVDYWNDYKTNYSAVPDAIQMGAANAVFTTADTFSSIGAGASGLVFGQDAWPTQALDGWNGAIGWTQDTINGAEAAPETPAGDGLKRDMTTSGTGDQANAGATTTEQPAQKPQDGAAKTQTADASDATKDDKATLAGQTGTPVGGTPPVEPAAPGNGSGGNGGGGRTLQGRGRGSSTPTADGEGPGMAGAWDFIMPEEHDGAWDRNNYGQTVSNGLDAGKGLLSRGFNYVSDLYNHTIPTMVGEKNAPMAQLAMGGLMAWLALRFTTGAWTAATNISYGKIAIGLAAAVGIMHFMSGRKSEGFVFDGENTNSLERPSKTNNGNHTMNELRIGERPPLLSGSVQPFMGNPDDGLVRGESALDKAAGLSGSANATFSGGAAPVLPKAGDNDIVIKLDGDAAVQGGNSPHVPRGAGSTDFVDHNGSLDAVGIDQQRDFGPPYPPAAGSSAPASRFDHHAP